MDLTDEMDATDEQVYGKYSAELLRFAAGLVGPSAADDVLSQAFVKAISSPRWSQIKDRRSYLYRTVLNETRQHFRGDRRRLAREFRAAQADTTDTAESAVDLAETLALLSTAQRAVVFLTY
ncbi:MAG TPA: sigma factor [Ilumatobacteraceae bacterium]|nr:sigma factor [Ilumatobacteraceae bacterium]HRB02394.1 sigma factor [Ilumatobacteraceae bacterium]